MTKEGKNYDRLMISYTKARNVKTFRSEIIVHFVLMDTFKGIIKSRTDVNLSSLTESDDEQLAFLERLITANGDEIFPLTDLLKLGRPINDKVYDAAKKVMERSS